MNNGVIDLLRRDHLNIARLLSIIDEQAELAAAGDQVGLEALGEAIDYFADYPARHQHPLEDALCRRLKRARPAVARSIDLLLYEHVETASRLAQFKDLIVGVRQGRDVRCTAFASTAGVFVNAELEHMARENDQLFPAALAVLGPDDSTLLQEQIGRSQDPLFGIVTTPHFECLRQLLDETGEKTPAKLKAG